MVEDVWVKSLSWRHVGQDDRRRCRWSKGACSSPAEFEVNRSTGHGDRWWAYCADHVRAFGNRILGLEVQTRVPANSAAAKRGWVQ